MSEATVNRADKLTTEDLRALVVRIALGELGQGQERYTVAELGADADVSWCGIFALWCLHQAGLAKGVRWITRRGFLLPEALDPIAPVGPVLAEPGDIAYFSASQHHAVVAEQLPNGRIRLVNGNSWDPILSPKLAREGKPTDVVAESTRWRSEAAGYFSIRKYLPHV